MTTMTAAGFGMDTNADPVHSIQYPSPPDSTVGFIAFPDSNLASDPQQVLISSVNTPQLHVSPTELAPTFGDQLDGTADPTYIPDFQPTILSSFSSQPTMSLDMPPSSLMSSPLAQSPVLNPPPSFGTGILSSLQSALDPLPLTGARSRAGTIGSSVSPVPVPSTSAILTPPDPVAQVKEEDVEGDAYGVTGAMLKRITAFAKDAMVAANKREPEHLMSLLADIQQQVASSIPDLIQDLSDLTISSDGVDNDPQDSSRKRCGSSAVNERPIKAPKMEPKDDTANLETGFVTPPVLLPATARSASRPPTPPAFQFNHLLSTATNAAIPNFPAAVSEMPVAPGVPVASPYPLMRAAWSDTTVPTRHTHSLSAGSISMNGILPTTKIARATTSAVGRMSRSGSMNGSLPAQYPFSYRASFSDPQWGGNSPASATNGLNSREVVPSPPALWPDGTTPISAHSAASSQWPSPAIDLPAPDEEHLSDEEEEAAPAVHSHASPDQPVSQSSISDIPLEYRGEVDRVFFEYLNRICSNLDSTDSKGEAIHQTLMAKKMQRLDESKDFRPFKFRIKAFTDAFLEELARQGYPEEKIPMKKIRNYLWRQQYILRFNEDGRKVKSKGNHIWNVEARKVGEGTWEFRPFHRKLAGTPPSVAYAGLLWTWKAHIWDPQASWQNVPVHYSSPSLPSWLSWKDETLSGICPADAQSCELTAVAKYVLDGQEGQLTHTFTIAVNQSGIYDAGFSRPPTLSEIPRAVSDPTVYTPRYIASAPVIVVPNDTTTVTAVLHGAVLQAAASPKKDPYQEFQAAKQQKILSDTLSAYESAVSGPTNQNTLALAQAASDVVAEAAQTLVAPFTLPADAINNASVADMSAVTASAIAVAVSTQPFNSSETQVVIAAKELLHNHNARPVLQPSPNTRMLHHQPMATNPYPNIPPLPSYTT